MHNQLIIEKYKAKRFIIMYLAAAVLAAAGFFLGLLKLPEYMDTAYVFSLSICDTSFMFLISLAAAWFAGNDFQNRTIHNEIKIGYSRFSVFTVRTITAAIMAMLLHLTYVFATVLGFSVKYRFDSSILSVTDFVWLLVVMLQICANICIVMLIVFSLKKVTSGIAVTVVFSFVSCNILRNFISKSVFRLTCFSLAQTSDSRTLALSAVFAAAVIVISLTATHFVFRKAEIK
ncbi:MAG: ABC transporter permease [Lachnospiraceae bacterium]|nr:ABC transporter permease [Lachnospiraceae bacterium]MCM1239528.1 ABC transporter permease [Lachnospiraceae bacterium]